MSLAHSLALASLAAIALCGCATAPARLSLGPDGRPLPLVYRVAPADVASVRARVLERVNAIRAEFGAPSLQLDAALGEAATRRALDMSGQPGAGHLGSDGSSPSDRARAAGYPGTLLGEVTADTYASDGETIAAWMTRADTRSVLTDRLARDLGLGVFQSQSGRIRWVLMFGDGDPGP